MVCCSKSNPNVNIASLKLPKLTKIIFYKNLIKSTWLSFTILLLFQDFLFDFPDAEEMLRRLERVGSQLHSSNSGTKTSDLTTVVRLLENSRFQRLLDIHNTIQAVQCFQCPPAPLCCDAKILVREVSSSIIHFHHLHHLSCLHTYRLNPKSFHTSLI